MLDRLRRADGQALVFVALAVPLFFGMAMVVVDGSQGFAKKRQMQNASDAAAIAAARDLQPALDPATCDAACLSGVRVSVKATVESYSAQNQGPDHLTGGSGADAAQCAQPSDTNCYTWPYHGSNGKVEVRLQTTVSTFFAKIFGFAAGFLKPRTRSVAAATGITETHCEFDPPVPDPDQYLPDCTIPGDTVEGQKVKDPDTEEAHCVFDPPVDDPDQYLNTEPPCTIPGQPAGGGESPAIIFVYSTECQAVHVHNGGSGTTIFTGAIVSNGGYDIDTGVQGNLLRHRASSVTCQKLAAGSWNGSANTEGRIERIADADCVLLPARCLDWGVPNPTLSSGPPPSAATFLQERDKNGNVVAQRQCTMTPDGWRPGTADLVPNTVYCNRTIITVRNDTTFTDPRGVAFVAPKVKFEDRVSVTPLASLYKRGSVGDCDYIGGILIYAWATGNGAVDLGSGAVWAGGIFAPNGKVSGTGKDTVATYGYIQAGYKVDYGAGNATFTGTGPCEDTGTPPSDPIYGNRVVTTHTGQEHCVFDPPVPDPDQYLPDCIAPGTPRHGTRVTNVVGVDLSMDE
jgi:Flp pilus assembly protein TadG